MANPSKDKGTWAETQVVKGCEARGVPARREVLHGNKDHGDVHILGGRVVAEVKWRPRMPSPAQAGKWMEEADAEALNAGADLCALIYNRPGYGAANIGEWCVTMWLGEFLWLAAGYSRVSGLVPPARIVTISFDAFCELLLRMPEGSA